MPNRNSPISHQQRKQYQEFSGPPSSPISSPTTSKEPFSGESDSDSSSQKWHMGPPNLVKPDLSTPPHYKESPYVYQSLKNRQSQRAVSRPTVHRNNSYNTTSSTSSIHKSPLSNSKFQINARSEAYKYPRKQETPFENEALKRTSARNSQDTKSQSENTSLSDIPLEEINNTRDKPTRNLPPGFGDDEESRSSVEFLEAFENEEKGEQHSKHRKGRSFCTKKLCVFITFIPFVGLIIGLCVFLPRVPSSAIVSIEVLSEPIVSSLVTPPYTFNVSTSLLAVFNNFNQYAVTVTKLNVNAYPRYGYQLLGQETIHNIHLPANRMTFVKIPLNMSYAWDIPNDNVWTAFAFACKPELIYLTQKNAMSLEFKNTLSISGFAKTASIQWHGSFVCPN